MKNARRITFDLTDDQWVHVIACTGMCAALGQTWWGLLAFPFWYAVAFAGQFLP
jgi:hypothetical protein